MQRTFHRDRFTWLAYLSLAFYGYFLNVLGPITPFLKDELQLTYTVSSFHFTAFAVRNSIDRCGWTLVNSTHRKTAFSLAWTLWYQCKCYTLIDWQDSNHHHRSLLSHGIDRFPDSCHYPCRAL